MPLDAADAVVKTTRINLAFARIGNEEDTMIPKTRNDMSRIAWELFIAQHLCRIGDARKKRAVKAAEDAGIIFDPAVTWSPAGTNAVIYQSDSVLVTLAVATPRESVDHVAWVAALLVHRPRLAALCAVLTKNHTTLARAAHTFAASLATV
jgi:hypothetical protein